MRHLSRPAAATLLALAAGAAMAVPYKATLLVRDDDPRLARNRVERAYLGHPTGTPADGLNVALKEAQLEMDASGTSVALEVVSVGSAQAARDAAAKAEKAGAAALVADLPADWLLAATDAVKLPIVNVGEPADRLREKDCRPRLLHILPSERMRADALAQWMVARKWSQVLMLTGPTDSDRERAAVAQTALKRYGLKLVAAKPYKLSADPRERDLANPLLLTQGSYDVVWVVDSDGEFARALPYRTVLPRPVIGDAGLTSLAWHAQFERFGAPQVSRRFAKAASGRTMTAHDWSSWLAGKALAAAAVAAPKGPAAAFAKALAEQELDGSKGVAMTFRPWDGQLRQTMLLTDGVGVVGSAPVEGMLHPKNNLDTLGVDAPEKLCKARP
ncbi:branched-chain amino acid ABC transporter substrate-binding protein [Ideonella sp. A 288]|uniref:branched-chain amino acid ABC transporter substrate-binding protein n=1 Tax=Ideonella sp. A 288 TaxID=1962181 RepID=UPI000B4B06F9|nr:branched-chain amino acid ABC transporter substrate-binding protein [Ideonella sp. A 288]